jgi:DNA polymerase-3 subunit beta
MLTTASVKFSVSAGDLADALKRVRHAMSQEETRYYLNGAYLHNVNGRLHIVATDGHRLARVETQIECGAMPSVILPAAAVGDILKTGIAKRAAAHRQYWLDVAPSRIAFADPNGAAMVECDAVDGTFPDYLRIIPRGNDKTVRVDREELTAGAAAIYGFAKGASKDSRYHGIKFDFRDDRLMLSAERDNGRAEYRIPCDPISFASAMQIGFNGRYVLDILDALDSDVVTLHLADPGSPTIFGGADRDSHATHVLMPVRL